MANTREISIDRAPGYFLMGGAALAILFMWHHPSTSSHDLASALGEIRDKGIISAWVHGLLIVVMVGIWFGTWGLTRRLGTDRALPVLGFMIFGFGTLAYCLAAMVSGFVVPEIGTHYAGLPADQLEQARGLLRISGITNQAFARAGLIGTSLGILCWSFPLLTRAPLPRLAGVLGLILGVLPAGLLLTGKLSLHLPGMTAVVLAHSTWYLLVGLMLVRGKLAAA